MRKVPSWEKVERICVLRLWCPLYLVRRLKPAQALQQAQLKHTSRSGAVLAEGGSDAYAADMVPIVTDHQAEASSAPTAPPAMATAHCVSILALSHVNPRHSRHRDAAARPLLWVRRPQPDEWGRQEG